MAFRTWVKLLAATLGVAALAGASQLGLVYGLGIVRLTRVLDVTTRDQWTAQLAWIAWIPMLAAIVGALTGAALLRRWSPTTPAPGLGAEVALAVAAAVGAAVVVPLTMQPARTSQIEGVNPVVVIAIAAGLGALIGVFAAWAALAQAVARWSLITMGAAVWLIALVSVAPSLAPSDPLPAVRLGVFDAGFLSPAVTQRTALATMPALALLIGALLGWTARRRELPTLTIALAGLPGPALLTIAYLIAGPGTGDDRYQVVPYWAAMTATGAGVLGSVLAAVLRRNPETEDPEADDTAAEKLPLPKRSAQPESAIAVAGEPRAVDTGVLDLPPRDRPTATPADPTGTGPGTAAVSAASAVPAAGPRSAAGAVSAADAVSAAGAGPAAEARSAESAGSTTGHGAGAGPGAGLGGPAQPVAKPEKPARRGRRSSVADAFIGRTGEYPSARPQNDNPAPTPRHGGGGPAQPRHNSPDDSPTGLSNDDLRREPAPFNAFSRGRADEPPRPGGRPDEAPRPNGRPDEAPSFSSRADEPPRFSGAPWSPAETPPKPYVPEPATRPLAPGVGTADPEPTPARSAGGRFGRGLRPFGRGRNAEPLTPEPTPISAPLPHPDPVTPPLAVTPAPRAEAAPGPAADDGKRKPKNGKDEDYVDWVSGLGK